MPVSNEPLPKRRGCLWMMSRGVLVLLAIRVAYLLMVGCKCP